MALSDPYYDPDDLQLFLTVQREIQDAFTSEDLIEIAHNRFKDFILERSPNGFSDDIPALQSNWEKMCEILRTQHYCTLIVRTVPLNNTIPGIGLLNQLCSRMTQKGICLRMPDDYMLCEICQKIILTEGAHKKYGDRIDWSYTGKCKRCKD